MIEDEGTGGGSAPEQNEVSLVGRLLNAPKVRTVGESHKMARFMLAVPRSFRNSAGERSKETAFVPVVCWRALAERAETLAKGGRVRLGGCLKTWQDKEGQKYRWEVQADLLEVLEEGPKVEVPPQEEAPKEEVPARARKHAKVAA